ncbi:clavaminate synthase family protein [Aliamphritea hakodatensis]|uniref:clavaminate synthase family protein n=1 Tax=Aliamphritea hakodatensis TaxID=2895352 RepID=UPI0022FD6807|nr:clavaminate synthase family protein [Aliamphritea hakodatensis]
MTTANTIINTQSTTEGLKVKIERNGNSKEHFFSWLWLVDHSQEQECFHPYAKQRLLETFALELPTVATGIEISEDLQRLTLTWPTGKVINYTADYLQTVTQSNGLYDVIKQPVTLWDANTDRKLFCQVDHQDYLHDDEVLLKALHGIREMGVAIIRDVPLKISAAREVMERISYIRSSIFGEMWQLKSDGKIADTGSTPLDISPHSDGTYSHDAPGVMSLLCIDYDAKGGDNVLVDGFKIAQLMKLNHPEAYELLSHVEIPGQYIGDGAYLVAQRPVFHHKNGRLLQVSFNNHDRAPFILPEPQMSQVYEALKIFDRLSKDVSNQFTLAMRPGDMIIFDNWRLLHGRKAFEGQRHMAGSYINREDFESRLRMLQPRPLDMLVNRERIDV